MKLLLHRRTIGGVNGSSDAIAELLVVAPLAKLLVTPDTCDTAETSFQLPVWERTPNTEGVALTPLALDFDGKCFSVDASLSIETLTAGGVTDSGSTVQA